MTGMICFWIVCSRCILLHSFIIMLYFRHCGVRNPSWAELNNFVKFLNIQLNACEHSIYCNEAYIGDVLQGFKQFIVKFMIRMSRVCCKVKIIAHTFTHLIGFCNSFIKGCSNPSRE